MSSIEPDGHGCKMNGTQEISGGLVVACCESPELLQLGEEVLDEMPGLVEVVVTGTGDTAVGLGWDHDRLSSRRQRLDHALVGVECLVSDNRVSLNVGQQVIGSDQVVGLPAGQEEAGWIAERVDHRVDLCAKAAARPPDRLVSSFFWAPALC